MIRKSQAVAIRETLGSEWTVQDLGYSECPRPVIALCRTNRWWMFSWLVRVASVVEGTVYVRDERYADRLYTLLSPLGLDIMLTGADG